MPMTQTPEPRDGHQDSYANPSAEPPATGQAPSYGPAPGYGPDPGYGAAPGYGPAPGGAATEYGQAPSAPPPYGYDPTRGYDPSLGSGTGSQLAPQDERTWGLMSHLSVLIAGILSAFTLGWLGPLLIMLIQGPKSPFVRHHAVEALNFFISLTIYFLISGILIFLIIGIPMMIGVFLAGIVLPILATVKANAGEYYRYPFTIRLIK